MHKASGIFTPLFLPPFLLSPGHHFPCSWQAHIKEVVSEGLSERKAHWQEKKFRDYWQDKERQRSAQSKLASPMPPKNAPYPHKPPNSPNTQNKPQNITYGISLSNRTARTARI